MLLPASEPPFGVARGKRERALLQQEGACGSRFKEGLGRRGGATSMKIEREREAREGARVPSGALALLFALLLRLFLFFKIHLDALDIPKKRCLSPSCPIPLSRPRSRRQKELDHPLAIQWRRRPHRRRRAASRGRRWRRRRRLRASTSSTPTTIITIATESASTRRSAPRRRSSPPWQEVARTRTRSPAAAAHRDG